jgi:uncharacterized membrane protein YfcA
MDLITLGAIFGGAIIIGILAVLMFLSFPLFQLLFPDLSLAAIIGTIKIGSVFRNLTALWSIRQYVNWSTLQLAPALCLGSIIGSWQTVSFSAGVIPIVLAVGWLVQEFGKKLPVPHRLLLPITFLVGVYGGIMLLITALLGLTHQAIGNARASALFLELLVSAVAVAVFWQVDLINWPIAAVWVAGSVVGGLMGGLIFNETVHWSASTQQWIVRGSFFIAFIVAVWKVFLSTN